LRTSTPAARHPATWSLWGRRREARRRQPCRSLRSSSKTRGCVQPTHVARRDSQSKSARPVCLSPSSALRERATAGCSCKLRLAHLRVSWFHGCGGWHNTEALYVFTRAEILREHPCGHFWSYSLVSCPPSTPEKGSALRCRPASSRPEPATRPLLPSYASSQRRNSLPSLTWEP
jgi:hypothetical protein